MVNSKGFISYCNANNDAKMVAQLYSSIVTTAIHAGCNYIVGC